LKNRKVINHCFVPGDLERDAGPELDDDGGVAGKDGDEGGKEVRGLGDQSGEGAEPPPPGTELNGAEDNWDQNVVEKTTNMNVEEFEPLYD
jgi:hypothetical protein